MAERWTLEGYVAHNEALREEHDRFLEERDRRYTEVKNAEEKALRIKEQADRDALGLAREIQTYKDEKANQLREQINSERGLYVSKVELKPLADYVTAQQGRSSGVVDTRTILFAVVGLLIAGAGLLLALRP